MKVSKPVGIWIRVSTEDQAKGESPEHHEQRARMYAEVKGWNVKEVYHLEAVSGKSVIEHSETKRMLQDVKDGRITGLIFSKLARFARNTRELLDFSALFQENDADLISLHESLDTSTPAGRFFYTLIAAMAEWEREEIAERVKASVPIRAKLGKSLGGEAPYGYKWVNKQLEIDENESPIRKLMFELFAQHKRKSTVAKALNERGYRTRKGGKFGNSSIHRYLTDPIAKGLRRVNYTKSTGDGKHWVLKPKEEWIYQQVPAIVSKELWDTCNHIIDSMTSKTKKTRRKAVHLFSGVLTCKCGKKMYMRSNSPAYVCSGKTCKNKILPDIIEEIFEGELKNFLFTDKEIQKHLDAEQKKIADIKKQLQIHENRIAELNDKIKMTLELYYNGQIPKDSFEKYHEPLHTELKQHEQSTTNLKGTIDALRMQTLSNDQVLHDARDLYSRWSTFTVEDKKIIIEAISKSIIVGEEDIDIHLNYIPTITQVPSINELESLSSTNEKAPPSSPLLFLPLKLIQLLTTPMSLRLLQSPRKRMRLSARNGTKIPQQN